MDERAKRGLDEVKGGVCPLRDLTTRTDAYSKLHMRLTGFGETCPSALCRRAVAASTGELFGSRFIASSTGRYHTLHRH